MKRGIRIKQLDRQDCAAAALASIASHYGLKEPITNIRRKCGTTREGTNIKGILEAASYLHLEARPYRSSLPCYTLKSLSGIPVPSILHFKDEDGWLHFVVLYKVKERWVEIMDPSDGHIHRVDEEDLLKRWTGYIIVLTPAPDFQKGDHTTPILTRLITLIRLHKGELFPSLAGSIIYVLLGLGTSLFIQYIIDDIIPTGDTERLMWFSVGISALVLLSIFIGYIRNILLVRGGIKIDATLIMEYIRHILHLPLSFYHSRGSGEISSRVGDAYKIRGFISSKMVMILISALALVLSAALLFSFYWKLALVTLAFIPLYGLLYWWADKINQKNNRNIIEAAAKFENSTLGAIASAEAVKYFSGEDYFYRKVEERYANMGEKLYIGGRGTAGISAFSDILTHTLTIIIIVLGTTFVFKSELTLGELVSFFTITGFFTSPITILIESSHSLNDAKVAAQRLFEVMDLQLEGFEETECHLQGIPDEGLSIENLSFRYPGQRGLLQNLTLHFPKGKITTITGGNGCGKSTIASLLMRSYEPDSGTITIGNMNINHFPLREWRKHISIIPQQLCLFDGSILENITMGESEVESGRIIGICTLVGMIDFIKALPEGLLSRVGEGGKLLSGGERCKVAFARALFREPHILILDEVTSPLDDVSRQRIYGLARELADKGMTIINISHDTGFVPYSDYIVDLNNHACA